MKTILYTASTSETCN